MLLDKLFRKWTDKGPPKIGNDPPSTDSIDHTLESPFINLKILHDVDEALLVPKRLHTIRSVINNVGPLDETLARNYFIRLIREIKENERNDRLTIIDVDSVVVDLKTSRINLISNSGDRYNESENICWSLGILLYSMLCAQRPFRKKKDAIKGRLNKFPSGWWPSFPARHLIRCLLQPNERYRIIPFDEILSHEWFQQLECHLDRTTVNRPRFVHKDSVWNQWIDRQLLPQHESRSF